MTRKVMSTPMMTFMRLALSEWNRWPELGWKYRYPSGFQRHCHGGWENGWTPWDHRRRTQLTGPLIARAGFARGCLLHPRALYDLAFGLRDGVGWIGRAPMRAATSAGTP